MKNVDLKRISAIVLAAGQSKRMGDNKLLMSFRGKPMLMHTLDLILSLDFGEKILVISKETAAAIEITAGFAAVINETPENGQSLSLKLGVNAASLDYYMFFLADMPLLTRIDVLKIISETDGEKIIVPKSENAPANPVIFPKKFLKVLLSVEGDMGGRGIIAAHESECKTVVFENTAVFKDIDTPEEYSSFTK